MINTALQDQLGTFEKKKGNECIDNSKSYNVPVYGE